MPALGIFGLHMFQVFWENEFETTEKQASNTDLKPVFCSGITFSGLSSVTNQCLRGKETVNLKKL